MLVAALIAAFMVTFVGRPYVIPSQSMEPTLHGCSGCTGDRIYVEKLSYYGDDPEPGDVVVFVGPPSWNTMYTSIRSSNPVVRGLQNFLSYFGLVPPDENNLVKRVIAVGGQTVQCCDLQGRVVVDGKPLNEPYVVKDYAWDPDGSNAVYPRGRVFGPVKVPDGYLWVMGDNRNESRDSRAHVADDFQGAVPIDNVRGRAVFKIWPPGRIGSVEGRNPQS
ncbi:signal peptidase I [Nocardia asteroides NBRC 15531]|uniref:Signal peptidase I n=1 Tax=Nocardia asteroides NBRC 15531 TaxID=1110697 RepID=U5EA91_NOCAS|nr:signal peptidase I [Nocardia asteroides]TLF70112.1 signal peptidase I [Nocardia asteroides NBRC 15531]UGT49638.1 signal peptidase I [Nocardia asteroides]GAD84265.1 signal peptidase I [Nocardia asteroides NBRC 15531]